MWKWFNRGFLLLVVGWIGMSFYGLYRGGYLSIPDLPDDAYPISFKSGFRAILVKPEVSTDLYRDGWKYFRRLTMANDERRYFGVPLEVPFWMTDAWSFCYAATEEERSEVLSSVPDEYRSTYAEARLEGICWVEADGKKTARGFLFSAPRL